MGKVIGIDLGTTKCCVAVLEGGQPIVITNSEGGRTTPTMVGFGRAGDRCIGQLAQRQSVTNAENTVFSVKRLIGRRWENTEQERSRVPYTCVPGRGNTVDVQIRGKIYTPQEITAMLLRKSKQDAESYLGVTLGANINQALIQEYRTMMLRELKIEAESFPEETIRETVTQAVIAVPACFNSAQRQAIKDAGEIAGLEVLQVISEPMAAALAYSLNRSDRDERIIIFDLGGGTFDVSILQLNERRLEMIATCGSNHLGGDDFDHAIVCWLLESFKQQEGIALAIDKMALQRLREVAEKAKIELSYTLTTSVNLPFITADETGPKHLEIEVTRTQFEALISPVIQEIIQITEQMLKQANLTSDDYFDHILLIGGSTRIPAVYQAIWQLFTHQSPERSIHPDEAIALGAAIQAGILNGELKAMQLVDVTPSSSNSRSTADMGGLSPEEIDRMRQEAEAYEVLEGEREVLKEMKEQADALFYTYEATICDNSELLSEDLKTEGANRAAELKSAIANPATTIDEIKQKLDSFQQILLDIGASVYRNSSEVEEDFNYWNDIFDDESDFDDDDFTGGVAPVPRPWKPTPPPLMDGEAVD